ncbi:DUF885 domain-containing protein [Galbitalea soli]|uniref:DUF885 domain-containing protein n=1 Tax=Galbitalea soli TaxID=1268042 RepID=A0A7C9TPA7_9MICO|nr:DUF885 domain-containing protein [Galbitalea soli]NEM90179.1 DUF885 domain-containing protein [Galbitalea soli]NYJ30887.1 uncharacterized protein (DUF885 family) [Galbitalea soli]
MTVENQSTSTRATTPIDAIAEKWVTTLADLAPTLATYIGLDNGRTGDWEDFSPEGHEALVAATRSVIAELESATPIDEVDRVTKTDLLDTLTLELQKSELGLQLRDVNVIASPVQSIREIFDIMPTSTEKDWSDVSSRLNGIPGAIDGYIATLREGIARGIVPAARQVREVIAQSQTTANPAGLFGTLVGGAEGVSVGLSKDLETGAEVAAAAYGSLADFFERELLPVAGEKDAVGREIYELASRSFLGATIDLDETYEWGLEELQRMVDEQTSIAHEIKPGASVEEAIEFLATDASRKLHGTDALREWMQETSDRAIAELSASHFDIPDPVKRLECMIAPNQTGIIYYTGPTDDFSRPGRMWWSVPEGVTEFDTWRELTTVYHEGVPGHHLQIGQAVYNRDTLNSYRRLLAGTSGHAEGWALYAERLMEELGYLDDPADRLGMLDGQRMRAARVVLDIGVHLEKQRPDGQGPWTGEYAFDFMGRNVNMNAEFVRFEVHRYLGWPGQAPSYKVGQRIWEQIRDEYRAREGAAFDPKAFHKRALDLGGVGLDTLKTALLR